ncbi:HPP family-domain-containing protein [Clohesyomyces aquaticus]|uniref:HPP family-domain-containing protein n=1 Tax=Clohesyomyces aquaticus TaxID=1231657 RepID=A0A1Y1Y7W1_9PLEO|nr:HPP family-domain-containing protein [Clohesyomyces aquaticus]
MPPRDENDCAAAEHRLQAAISRLPRCIGRFLGYRREKTNPSLSATYVGGLVGAFGGIALLQAVFGHTQHFTSRGVPQLVSSYGASAILCYGAIDSPLAQPRPLIGGHFFSATVGVIISILFRLDLSSDADRLSHSQWIAGALAAAIALAVMHFTKTMHPPGGTTALLPCVDSGIRAMRWYFLPVVLLSSALVLVSALLINNIQRQYPTFWIAPPPLPPELPSFHQRHQHRATWPGFQVQRPESASYPLKKGYGSLSASTLRPNTANTSK